MSLSIEMLTPERAAELEDVLMPLFQDACDGNDIAKMSFSAEDIMDGVKQGQCAAFLGYSDGVPECTVVIQFAVENGKQTADVVALAGKNLMRFKKAYWETILEWLRANNIKYLDAYTSHRLGPIFLSKFGFDKSCAYVRMAL